MPTRRQVSALTACACVTVLALGTKPAQSQGEPARGEASHESAPIVRPNGAALVALLGDRAAEVLAPNSGQIGALVALPRGTRAEDYGLEPVAPGIGRLRARPARIEAFGAAHPELHLEVAPPLHSLLDRTGEWIHATVARRVREVSGRGVLIGVADTGLDVTHPEMRDANGLSRVRWMLDLSLEPIGVHRAVEERFGIKDDEGKVVGGAVFSNREIDQLIGNIERGECDEATGRKCAPSDEIGHGTHVAGIAASSGAASAYPGVAPGADVVFVRVTRGRGDGIENDDLVRAVDFMFDRADADQKPMVVNLSLGSDFGPHDGSFLWEQVIASHVGPDHPGRAIVAAAGNSGSIVETPIHQSVRVTKGSTMRVPIRTAGAESGSVQVWLTLRRGSELRIGLDGPDGEWIAPIPHGRQSGRNTSDYNAGVIYGAGVENSPIPPTSRGAVVVWTGRWPSGTYHVTLEGTGMVDLYLQGLGDASLGSDRPAAFAAGVREGTINLPATHPAIIGVGCTVNRARWTSVAGAEVALRVPLLDAAGGLPAPRSRRGEEPTPTQRDLLEGEVCWFSSAGPTAVGVPKPEIAAPGALVVSALSRTATPGVRGSIFTNPSCPQTRSGADDPRCLQVDDQHGIAVGTSMSSPVVAGVIALLFEKDPTLTQDQVLALLQAGAHRFRVTPPFEDQSGPGEVDAWGSLDALDQMRDPSLQIPSAAQSWVTLSSDYVPADGSTPMTAILELRTAGGDRRADFFDANRLAPVLLVDSRPVEPPPELHRRGPGVWFFTWTPAPGQGGARATFGATFDGEPIVAAKTLPIATDRWTAAYPSACSATPSPRPGSWAGGLLAGVAVGVAARRRRRRIIVRRE
jgi:subtilisin family serine protease